MHGTGRTIMAEGQRGLFEPPSDWTPPATLPQLRNCDVAVDTEERDDGLATGRGPGWATGEGYVCGVSAAWGPGPDEAIYVPLRHPETECRSVSEVTAWLEDIFRYCRVYFFSAGYDMGWLWHEGLRTWPERADDAQTMAVMLDENHDEYSLTACCARAGVPGKDETLLREAAHCYGVAPRRGSIKHGLWRLPARHVGPYAEGDARATLALARTLYPLLEAEGQAEAYRTEIQLARVVHQMRLRGIRVSVPAAETAQGRIRDMRADALRQLDTYRPPDWHRPVAIEDVRSPERLARIFDAEGIEYPRTPKTRAPSFTKFWLEAQTTPAAKLVRRARQLEDLAEKFIGTYILGHEHRGRIHAEVHPLRGDDGGARTSRFSYSNPPLQQMPSRDPELAPIVRGVFLPEEGEVWYAPDYSQQEPRLNLHFAHRAVKAARRAGIDILGTQEWVDRYVADPATDYHGLSAEFLQKPRKACKDMNQALAYRAGADKVAAMMGISQTEAEDMVQVYHERIPWVRGIARFCERRAQERGSVRLIDGARRHYSLWQPRGAREGGAGYAHGRAAAEARWPGDRLERAYCYQAGNSLVQGSAARQTKIAIVRAWETGGHVPLVQMHDEVCYSVASRGTCEEIADCMREAVRLVIPVRVDMEAGPTWGEAKHDYREVFG